MASHGGFRNNLAQSERRFRGLDSEREGESQMNKNTMYQLIYTMPGLKIFKHDISRYPRLDTVLMVEEAIRKARGNYTVRQLWQKLPKKVMWRTYITILDYLEYSGKIITDKDKVPVWIWDPEGIKELKRKGLMVR